MVLLHLLELQILGLPDYGHHAVIFENLYTLNICIPKILLQRWQLGISLPNLCNFFGVRSEYSGSWNLVDFKAEPEFTSIKIFRFKSYVATKLLDDHFADDEPQPYSLRIKLTLRIFDRAKHFE